MSASFVEKMSWEPPKSPSVGHQLSESWYVIHWTITVKSNETDFFFNLLNYSFINWPKLLVLTEGPDKMMGAVT